MLMLLHISQLEGMLNNVGCMGFGSHFVLLNIYIFYAINYISGVGGF